MGRYYSGDIEGKFWFGVQASDDGEFFGAQEQYKNENEVEYYVNDLDKVQDGIRKCLEALGQNKRKLDRFFEDHTGYNDEMLILETKIPAEEIKEIMVWYARLSLGEKIEHCLLEQGEYYYTAEL